MFKDVRCYVGVWDEGWRKYGGKLKVMIINKEITHNDLLVDLFNLGEDHPKDKVYIWNKSGKWSSSIWVKQWLWSVLYS